MSKRLDYEVGDCIGRLGGDGDARLSHRPIMGISVISRIGSVMIAAPKTGPVQVAGDRNLAPSGGRGRYNRDRRSSAMAIRDALFSSNMKTADTA